MLSEQAPPCYNSPADGCSELLKGVVFSNLSVIIYCLSGRRQSVELPFVLFSEKLYGGCRGGDYRPDLQKCFFVEAKVYCRVGLARVLALS